MHEFYRFISRIYAYVIANDINITLFRVPFHFTCNYYVLQLQLQLLPYHCVSESMSVWMFECWRCLFVVKISMAAALAQFCVGITLYASLSLSLSLSLHLSHAIWLPPISYIRLTFSISLG